MQINRQKTNGMLASDCVALYSAVNFEQDVGHIQSKFRLDEPIHSMNLCDEAIAVMIECARDAAILAMQNNCYDELLDMLTEDVTELTYLQDIAS